MSTLHPLSHGTPLSEFDIFSVPPTQLSVIGDNETEHRPTQPISVDRLAQIEFTTASNEYIKWSDTELYMRLRIKLERDDRKAVEADGWNSFTLENNLMHSMLQSVDLSINGRLITKSTITYLYRAYLDNLIGTSFAAKEGHLSSIGWVEHDGDNSRYKPKPSATDLSYGEYFELRGKLCLDIAQQGRAFIGGLSYKLDIRFNKPEMVFVAKQMPSHYTFSWEIDNLSLLVHRTIVSQGTLTAHARALQHATAKYPITRHEVRAATINSGMLDVMLESIFSGQLPRRILVGFATATSFRGNFNESALTFTHHNINQLNFTIDGQSYPRSPYAPNFPNKLYMREYYSFLQAFNQDSMSPTYPLRYEDYLNEKVFFAYNFAPDLGDGCGFGGYLNFIKTGNLGMHIRFESAPKVPLVAIVFAEFDNLIQIDKNLQVTTDYLV